MTKLPKISTKSAILRRKIRIFQQKTPEFSRFYANSVSDTLRPLEFRMFERSSTDFPAHLPHSHLNRCCEKHKTQRNSRAVRIQNL